MSNWPIQICLWYLQDKQLAILWIKTHMESRPQRMWLGSHLLPSLIQYQIRLSLQNQKLWILRIWLKGQTVMMDQKSIGLNWSRFPTCNHQRRRSYQLHWDNPRVSLDSCFMPICLWYKHKSHGQWQCRARLVHTYCLVCAMPYTLLAITG